MEYRCAAGHELMTSSKKRIDRCPIATCLDPRLVAHGTGSVQENERLAELERKRRERPEV